MRIPSNLLMRPGPSQIPAGGRRRGVEFSRFTTATFLDAFHMRLNGGPLFPAVEGENLRIEHLLGATAASFTAVTDEMAREAAEDLPLPHRTGDVFPVELPAAPEWQVQHFGGPKTRLNLCRCAAKRVPEKMIQLRWDGEDLFCDLFAFWNGTSSSLFRELHVGKASVSTRRVQYHFFGEPYWEWKKGRSVGEVLVEAAKAAFENGPYRPEDLMPVFTRDPDEGVFLNDGGRLLLSAGISPLDVGKIRYIRSYARRFAVYELDGALHINFERHRGDAVEMGYFRPEFGKILREGAALVFTED